MQGIVSPILFTVEPVKLNTCVHWTPAYIEHFFMSRHTPIENQWEATWIHWTPVYLEHWTPNMFPQATFNLSTLNILCWFETFHWKWGQMRYIRLTVLLSDIFQMLNIIVKFLTIWRKRGKDIVDFATKWSCFSNYPWFCFYFTWPPITQNLDTLNTCVHWTLFHFPWVFNVDRFHCIFIFGGVSEGFKYMCSRGSQGH